MNKYPERSFISLGYLLIIILLSGCAAIKKESILDKLADMPARKFENYLFDPESALISRITGTPGFALDYMRDMDGRKDYSDYKPDSNDLRIISEGFEILPPLTQKVLKERLIGIYFINNLLGSGLTDFVWDKNRKIYVIMFFNSRVFGKNISDWLTYKENTCFRNDNGNFKVVIDCGTNLNGFNYILIHESTHCVDYVNSVTPFVEPDLMSLKKTNRSGFTDNIWRDYYHPVKEFDFIYRKDITFYGINKGPRIDISNVMDVYSELMNSPFPSLYASQTWAEDFAETVTFYHLTCILKQPYKIRIFWGESLVSEYEPMKSQKVMQRFDNIKMFYE